MNNLGLYIREALEDKDEIYLFGIGTFRNERIPAYYDKLKDRFVPPSQIISMKAGKESSSNFVEFLADKEDISIAAAQLKWSEALRDIEESEEVSLDSLGILKSDQGVYEFIYTPDEIGDRFSEYEPIAEGEILKPIQKLTKVTPPPSLVEDEEMEYNEQELPSRRWLWPVIGTAICAVIAAIWFLNPGLTKSTNSRDLIVNNVGDRNEKANTVNAVPEQNAAQEPAIESVMQDSLNPIVSATEVPDIEKISDLIREPKGRFELIIAAFKTMHEAEEYVELTNSKGYQVYILKNNRANNLNKISYSSFQNEEEAEKALAKVRKELNAEAWLWENKRSNINN